MRVKRMMGWLVVELLLTVGAFAVEGREVALRGGTVATVPMGSVGLLDMTGADALVFRAAGKEVRVPYGAIVTVRYTTEVARHLGVLPAIAVGLVRKRERKHLLTLIYNEGSGSPQLMLLEISKEMPVEVMGVLRARAPQACADRAGGCMVPVQ